VTTLSNYIGGEWVGTGSGAAFDRFNPASVEDRVVTAPDSTAADVDQAVGHIAAGYREWAATPPETRADVLSRAAELLAWRADEIAAEIVEEEGKTLAEARVEARRTPQNLRFYAGEALRLTGETYPRSGNGLLITSRQPVGVVAAITPWNFPLNIPSRKLGPALAAGNGVVFKPSEVTPRTGQRLVEALLEAGVPDGALALVHGRAEVGKALVSDPRIGAVTFTGSTAVGESIHSALSPAVRCQLEMGGKNAVYVAANADLDKAADIVAKGAFGLSGQACTGTSRVVVDEAVHDALLDRVMERARAAVVGDGARPGVTMGPLATDAQWHKYCDYVEIGKESGRLETPSGRPLLTGGYFARPAVFSEVDPTGRLAQEEVFGPVLAVIPVAGYDEAVEVVNGTVYGLSAGIVTGDIGLAMRFAADVEAGVVKINQPTNGVAMNAPFGGMRMSSTQTSKEQAGDSMMRFYTTDKTVYLDS